MFVNANHKKAQEFIDTKELDKALRHFAKALEEHPNNAQIINDRAVLYIHLQQEHLAMQDFNLAVELDPEYSYRYASRAYAKDFYGDTNGAIADYQIAVQLDPDDAVANNNLGILLEKKGYKEKADRHFAKADKVAKHEKHFEELMAQEEAEIAGEENTPKPENGVKLQPKKIEKEEELSKGKLVSKIVTDKSTFKEFVRFIKNGFKVK
ncbi:Tetratricopeptide repeat-containing protein [Lishizhenia tianjinensis]|uniref:Tetratricopeptide repeat-containing protein n=1 Tax=Lishizhenia tianjinensis TaxID=477690 RepID=A0A1I6XI85_9FLAO|nr:tetratricopeptide repeat protein [Lishizhenia tianjinensis]SFT38118.1 Tetratricopeptide repeat-containing protein [Lishizhenia tianjinensis]